MFHLRLGVVKAAKIHFNALIRSACDALCWLLRSGSGHKFYVKL